jgi:hypothetical protein
MSKIRREGVEPLNLLKRRPGGVQKAPGALCQRTTGRGWGWAVGAARDERRPRLGFAQLMEDARNVCPLELTGTSEMVMVEVPTTGTIFVIPAAPRLPCSELANALNCWLGAVVPDRAIWLIQ